MKKVMSFLAAAVFAVGTIGTISFTIKEKSSEGTAWYYTDNDGKPDFSSPTGSDGPRCSGGGALCAIEVDLTTGMPTGNQAFGKRI